MEKISVIILLSLIILVGGCVSQPYQQPTQTGEQNQQGQISGETLPADSATIIISAGGFSPNSVTIRLGGTVTFVNQDRIGHRPASAVHPTHAVYPESGGCIGSMFDACHDLAEDETWPFTFNNAGTWRYHDHLNPSLTGTITVV